MFSLFEREAKNVVKELGQKQLKPVTSFHSSTQFRPFCLLRKKTKNIFTLFWEKPPIPTDFSLMDILEPSSTDPGVKMEVSGGAMMSHSSSLEMQILTVPHTTWTTLQKDRKLLKPEHSFLWECCCRKEDLYVVTEAVEVVNVPVFHSISNMEGDGNITFLGTSTVKGQGQGHINKKKSLSIPSGSILAYRMVKLLITEKEWAILYILDDKKTFQYMMDDPPWKMEGKLLFKSRGQDVEIQEMTLDFQSLQREVNFQKTEFVSMPGEKRTTLLSALHDLLGNRNALQDLEDMLEQVLDSGVWEKMAGPESQILSYLQDPSGSPIYSYITGLLYILGALAVLNDTQHNLLAQSLKKKILPQQLELVQSILEANFNQFHRCPFLLQPEFLSSLHGEDLTITIGLIEKCGLKLQKADQLLIWDPDERNHLCALYGALSCLLSLAED
ncbi:gasdermin-C isoform X2 [Notamacropus eugenii]|uniref:gasdermin-C isoform X2 n=1 Tax=Notamacropus eugenii TaxID=9315 RepID=UPI003B6761B8